jgi:formiminoglutamase
MVTEKLAARNEDKNWPRASDWIAGKFNSMSDGISGLGIFGAPLNYSLTLGHADLAPAAIRKALERYSVYDLPHSNDLRIIKVQDAGDLDISEIKPEQAVQPIADAIREFRDRNMPVIILGGDNGITRPGVHGLAAPLDRCGLLTLDAHFDLRDTVGGLHNGNPVRALLNDGLVGQHIVQIGIQSFANSGEYAAIAREHGIHYVSVEQVFEDGIERTMRKAFEQLRDLDAIYFDLDIDVLDRSYAPATPGSRPGGLMPWQLRQIAYICGSHYNIAAMDVVEIDPERDVADVTALSAAACILSFASGILERREKK